MPIRVGLSQMIGDLEKTKYDATAKVTITLDMRNNTKQVSPDIDTILLLYWGKMDIHARQAGVSRDRFRFAWVQKATLYQISSHPAWAQWLGSDQHCWREIGCHGLSGRATTRQLRTDRLCARQGQNFKRGF
jgi:hypothetical protein